MKSSVRAVLHLLLLGVLLGTGLAARADRLAIYRATGGDIVLMTDSCPSAGTAQRAYRRSGGKRLEGCWSANAQGNPVIRWRNGRVQELDQSRVRLTDKYAAMLDAEPPAATPRERPARPDFPRPVWCGQASHPHERLICRDAELSAADLNLAPLWRAYRTRQKDRLEQARTKSDYFRRLKACGADKECITREQTTQARFYRETLGLRAP